jgi:predicted RNase H-like HicB family nuclease
MTKSSQSFDLAIVLETVEGGRVQATVPAVPGAISVGRSRAEARENVLDALCELLSMPPQEVQRGSEVDRLRARIEVPDRELGRGL